MLSCTSMWANTAMISSTTVYKLMFIIIFSKTQAWRSYHMDLEYMDLE